MDVHRRQQEGFCFIHVHAGDMDDSARAPGQESRQQHAAKGAQCRRDGLCLNASQNDEGNEAGIGHNRQSSGDRRPASLDQQGHQKKHNAEHRDSQAEQSLETLFPADSEENQGEHSRKPPDP